MGEVDRFIDKRSRTHDQMVRAARSGKQNIAEGSMTSGTSKKTELKLIGVARASLEELLLDYQDFLRQKVLRIYSPDLLHNNETFHQFLVEKVRIPYQQDGYERSHEVSLIDFDNPLNNEFLAVNQYTIIENNQNKRPDILLFVNGIPFSDY